MSRSLCTDFWSNRRSNSTHSFDFMSEVAFTIDTKYNNARVQRPDHHQYPIVETMLFSLHLIHFLHCGFPLIDVLLCAMCTHRKMEKSVWALNIDSNHIKLLYYLSNARMNFISLFVVFCAKVISSSFVHLYLWQNLNYEKAQSKR